MDYTTVPRSLIYRDRRSLKEFGAYETESITRPLADALLQIDIIQYSDSERRALWFMNSAFHICTMIMLEEDPRWRISEYKIIATPRYWSNVSIPQCQILTLSLVLLLLNHLETPLNESHPLGESLRKTFFNMLYNEENLFTYHLLDDKLKNDPFAPKTIPNSMFAPRIIDKETVEEVINSKDSDWGRFTNYLEDCCLRDIIRSLGSTEEEKYNVINMLRKATGSTFLVRWNDRPEKLYATLDDIEKEIRLQYNPEAAQAIVEAEMAEMEKSIEPAPYEARIKELEEENANLKNTIVELQQPVEELSAVQKVRMELAFLLLKKAGLTDEVLQKQNNKQKVATLMSMLLDIHNKNKNGNEAQTCATYLSARDLSHSRHEDTINIINALLKELNIEVQI